MIPKDVIESHAVFAKFKAVWDSLPRSIQMLIVEDNADDIELLKRAVGHSRMDISTADSGVEAIRMMGMKNYDICLLDLKLPDMPGIEVLRWAKQIQIKTPFIVLTGLDVESPPIKEALSAGAECVFSKPLTPENIKLIFGGVK